MPTIEQPLAAATERSDYSIDLFMNDKRKSNDNIKKARKRAKTSRVPIMSIDKQHPLGIQPVGNLILSSDATAVEQRSRDMRAVNLGAFSVLPDEILNLVLQTLGAKELRTLGYCSRVFSAFATQDDLWKQLFVSQGKAPGKWYGTWRRTYYKIYEDQEACLRCDGFYSDTLYRPFFCTNMRSTDYIRDCLKEFSADKLQIPHLDISPSQEEFDSEWAYKPFILTSHKWPSWSFSDLVKSYGDLEFIQECVRWRLDVYAQYMSSNQDESPLYLFDREFGDKTSMASEYETPSLFDSDYLTLLKDIRPDYRWIIIGPERSGSTFHKDPNATSAWNAVIQGSKYWVMFPPDVLPPGVYTSADESSVTSPLSIAEWLAEFHKTALTMPDFKHGVCGPGEMLHVPSGWWHLVVNLEDTIAITQNFVPFSHIMSVLCFFHNKKDQISGFRKKIDCNADDDENESPNEDVLTAFIDKLTGEESKLTDGMIEKIKNWAQSLEMSYWDKLVDAKESGFSFGFGFDEDEDEDN
ncbi:uncharacterized protein V2V93DRAFT_364111 [Kockiozyma suomiensis]|uniref:uncharacterized protein n=1 Tax=Kockiozyma suomiensis TaxID=1337062 RepID=UPI00334325DE